MEQRRLSIVYADDDELVRETVAAVLIDAGMDVHACSDGREAVILCAQLSPRVVLLDLNMPGMDGLEAARRIREAPSMAAARLVAFTGRGTTELRTKATAAGFDEFLVKPLRQDVLIAALTGRL